VPVALCGRHTASRLSSRGRGRLLARSWRGWTRAFRARLLSRCVWTTRLATATWRLARAALTRTGCCRWSATSARANRRGGRPARCYDSAACAPAVVSRAHWQAPASSARPRARPRRTLAWHVAERSGSPKRSRSASFSDTLRVATQAAAIGLLPPAEAEPAPAAEGAHAPAASTDAGEISPGDVHHGVRAVGAAAAHRRASVRRHRPAVLLRPLT